MAKKKAQAASGSGEPEVDWTLGKNEWFAARQQGRPELYDTPEKLAKYIDGYFHWLEANPLEAAQLFAYKGRTRLAKKPLRRVPTIKGLCLFLGVSYPTWCAWKRDDHAGYRPDLSNLIEATEDMIYQEKFAGASSGLYDSRIIARDLGLVDKRENSGSVSVRIEESDADL